MSADRSPLRVALLGSFGEGNFGNEWTLDAFVELARRVRTDLDLTIWSQNPAAALAARSADQGAFRGVLLAAPGRPPRANPFLRLLGRAYDIGWMWRVVGGVDVLLVPGTGIVERLYQRPGGYPATLALLVTICRLRRRPFALVGIGAEVPADALSRRLVGYVLRRASLVTVRDDYSRTSVVETTGGRVDPCVHADLVLAAAAPDARPAEPVGERVLALGVMDYRGGVHDDGDAVAAAYLARTTDLARALVSAGWRLRLVAGDEDDLAVADRVASAVGEAAMVVRTGSLSEVTEVLAGVRVVVATRFHTVVAAVGVGRPVVSLGYGPKNADLLRRVGLGELAHEVMSYDIRRVVAQVADVDARADYWSGLVVKGRGDLLGAGVPGLAALLGSRPTPTNCGGLDTPSLVPRGGGSTNTLVSVVVATNRQSAYLDEALASVDAQMLTSWEGIVVDDGVPDPAWLDAVVARHPGFRIVRTRAGSVSRARNAGAARASGAYLAFLDDDDRWHPDRLARAVAAMAADPRYVAVCCPVDVIDEYGVVTIRGRAPARAGRLDRATVIRRDVWIACPNLMVRRDAFERVGGFDPRLRRAEDLDLALSLVELGEIAGVAEPLVDYRAHGTNVTRDRLAMAVAIDRVVRTHRARAPRSDRADHDASLRRNARYALFAARTRRPRRIRPAQLAWLAGALLRTPWISWR